MTGWLLLRYTIATLVGIVAVGRAVRLVTSDSYPPMTWLRTWWTNHTEVRGGWRDGWAPLLTCPWCFSPYATAIDLAWFLLAGGVGDGGGLGMQAWWVGNVWAAVSYLSAMLVVRDEPPPFD